MHNSNWCLQHLHPYNKIEFPSFLCKISNFALFLKLTKLRHWYNIYISWTASSSFIQSIPASVYLFSYTYMHTFMMAWFLGKHAWPKCDVIPHLLLYGGLQVSCKGQICITICRIMTLERVATGELPITWMANATGVLRYTKHNVKPFCHYGNSAVVFII